jgi:hypothetical protein
MEKKIYEIPNIKEEILELFDVIAMFNKDILGEIFDDDGERIGGLYEKNNTNCLRKYRFS